MIKTLLTLLLLFSGVANATAPKGCLKKDGWLLGGLAGKARGVQPQCGKNQSRYNSGAISLYEQYLWDEDETLLDSIGTALIKSGYIPNEGMTQIYGSYGGRQAVYFTNPAETNPPHVVENGYIVVAIWRDSKLGRTVLSLQYTPTLVWTHDGTVPAVFHSKK